MRIVVAAVLVACAITRASASTVERLSPEQLYADSDSIVDGTVVNTAIRWNAAATGLETVATVAVELTWRGPARTTVDVVAPGGTLGNARQIVIGAPDLSVGDRARWFLRDRGDGQLAVYGWAQGKWPAQTVAGVTFFAPAPRLAEDPTSVDRFAFNGMVWPAARMPVPYLINQTGTADLPMSDVVATIDAAFATWQAVPCAGLTFTNAGMTSLGVALDGYNVLTFIESGWLYGTEAAAATSLWIIDGEQTADIAFNGERFTWAIGPANSAYATTLDLQAVLTHELGHFSGLGHSFSAFDTMYYAWTPWQGQRTLSINDKLALCSLYPVTGDECSAMADCAPGEACDDYPGGRLCTGTADPIGAACNVDRVECDGFCLYTALDLSTGYCSRFCDSNADCPPTHHCDVASAGTMPVKVCFAGAPPVPPGSCTTDAQCMDGQHCDEAHGACTFECRTDEDCGAGATCDLEGICVQGVGAGGGGCQTGGDASLVLVLALLPLVRRRRRPMLAMIAVVSSVLAGCADRGMVTCGNGWACPLGYACDLAHRGCVLPSQLEACMGHPDGSPCMFPGAPAGTCIDGVCFAASCGNSVVDPGEACDDGNRLNDDGCSGDCSAVERCGDGTLQAGLDEQCDDGDLRDHDGCDSSCRTEQPDWRRSTSVMPRYRIYASIVHDPFRRRTVMFGGQEIALVNDTLEWNGLVWIGRSGVVGPSTRLAAPVTFDSNRGEVVLFGGLINGSTFGADTWVFDGVSWTRRTPQVSPSGRYGASLAYDTRRRRAVLFGGFNTSVTLGDTWEWDGDQWLEMHPAQAPSPRNQAVSYYDPSSGTTFLIGGLDPSGARLPNELWAWDGANWTRRATATVPTGVAFTMSADPSRGIVVLLTAVGATETAEWEWNGTDWTRTNAVLPALGVNGSALFYDQGIGRLGLFGLDETSNQIVMMYRSTTGWDTVPAPGEPPARDGAAMAYDAQHSEVLMFGGLDTSSAPLDDLWAWRGSTWAPLQPATGPAPTARSAHSMVYDASRGEMLVFAGHTASQRTAETWVWNGTTWRAAAPIAPREYMAAAYDVKRKRVVAFGGIAVGFDNFDHPTSETWEWDGTSWTQLAIAGPPPRSRAALSYDARRGKIVLFGGVDDYKTFDDVWEFDGTTWEQREPAFAPPARRGHIMVYDAARATTVVMGGRGSPLEGSQALGDTWEWNGDTWMPIATFAAPGPRDGQAAAYDDATAHVVAFGGGGTGETWSYGYDGAVPGEVCGGGHDVDRDGLVDCADPDCWWMCTPTCQPRTTCDPAAPQCGDAGCSTVESCRACPTDCGACTPECGDLLCDPGEVCSGDC